MSRRRPVNVSVKLGGRIRTSEQLFRRFSKECKDARIIEEWKKKQIHETKGQKRRRKKASGKARAKRNAQSQKQEKRQ
jgi:ribosomal protein S21|tara:strand:+ start:766 stop:999 length:234 start_codon:yes stop_codon:yes gene_type:complete